MKHIPGTKVNYVLLLKNRKHPIRKPDHIVAWIIKQKAVSYKKLQYHYYKQNCICYFCGNETILKPINDPAQPTKSTATIDHILPRSLGGTDHRDNILMACAKCNNRRGVVPVEVYKERKSTNANRIWNTET